MIRIGVITTVLLLASRFCIGQEDTIKSNQISFSDVNHDSASSVSLQEDQPPFNKQTQLSKDEIPRRVLKALQTEEQYQGWEKFPVYYDNNTDLYLIRTQHETTITTYGLNKNGKPVTVLAATLE